MRKIGEASEACLARNTCQHSGRVFHLSQDGGKLFVTEIILSDKAEFVRAGTGVAFHSKGGAWVGCCSFGQSVLVMSSDGDGYSAALVGVDAGRLSEATVHVASLTVEGDKEWPGQPYLCQVAESRALLCFDLQSGMWYCDVAGATLAMRKCRTVMPPGRGFCTLPTRLPDGKLLVAGGNPLCTDITLITTSGEPAFEKVGDIPGSARCWASTALIRDRFVLGFGGFFPPLDSLWIFDLRTHESSQVRQEGEWPPANHWVPLVVQGGTVYVVGGSWTNAIHSLSLSSLADLIVSDRVRVAFCEAIGRTSFAV